MYAALGGRPDISFAVALLSRFNQDPQIQHLTAVKRVLRYLKHTQSARLVFKRSSAEENLLYEFVDSDWANAKDRKSILGGYIYILAGAAVSWVSKKQSLVALSTEEAEYTAFTEASREGLWIKQLLDDITNCTTGPTERTPTIIYADNQAAIKHVKSEGITARTKHFDIRLHHSRDHQKAGAIDFQYIKSSENTADILTKGLAAEAHRRHVKGLGICGI